MASCNFLAVFEKLVADDDDEAGTGTPAVDRTSAVVGNLLEN